MLTYLDNTWSTLYIHIFLFSQYVAEIWVGGGKRLAYMKLRLTRSVKIAGAWARFSLKINITL